VALGGGRGLLGEGEAGEAEVGVGLVTVTA
jgi:hypothetical protein